MVEQVITHYSSEQRLEAVKQFREQADRELAELIGDMSMHEVHRALTRVKQDVLDVIRRENLTELVEKVDTEFYKHIDQYLD